MKRLLSALLILVVLLSSVYYAAAEDLSAMSEDDLLALRLAINNELAARYEPPVLEDGMILKDIFPDKNLAIYIRDEIGAFSINDSVTQEDLNRVKDIQISGKKNSISSLEGIQYLTNMTFINIYDQPGAFYIPDCFDVLTNLNTVWLRYSDITELPPSIVNCTSLKELNITHTAISSLPEDIGNLSLLKKIDISYTRITSLPDSIRLLDLDEFKRQGLDLGE